MDVVLNLHTPLLKYHQKELLPKELLTKIFIKVLENKEGVLDLSRKKDIISLQNVCRLFYEITNEFTKNIIQRNNSLINYFKSKITEVDVNKFFDSMMFTKNLYSVARISINNLTVICDLLNLDNSEYKKIILSLKNQKIPSEKPIKYDLKEIQKYFEVYEQIQRVDLPEIRYESDIPDDVYPSEFKNRFSACVKAPANRLSQTVQY